VKKSVEIKTIIWIVFEIILIAMIFTLVKIWKKNYNGKLNNPPSKVFVEEDLEIVFLSTQVEVVEIDEEGEIVVYTVKANGYKYKVLYQLCSTNYIGHYTWRYVRHTQIKD
jgi:hypothetical protein